MCSGTTDKGPSVAALLHQCFQDTGTALPEIGMRPESHGCQIGKKLLILIFCQH